MVSFFLSSDFPCRKCCHFFRTISFWEKLLPHTYFRVTTSTQQLHFRGSYFLRTAAFFSFFRTVTFSRELFSQNSFFFGAKLLQSKHFLRIRSFYGSYSPEQLFFLEELFKIKISKKKLLFQSRYSNNFFKKATFWK